MLIVYRLEVWSQLQKYEVKRLFNVVCKLKKTLYEFASKSC